MIKKISLGILSLGFTLCFAQDQPYFVPEKNTLNTSVKNYILEENEDNLIMLRITNNTQFEYIKYNFNDNIVCEFSEGQFYLNKKIISFSVVASSEIIKTDSLNLARKCSLKYIEVLNDMFFDGTDFYSKKINLLLKRNKVLSPSNRSSLVKEWFLDPRNGGDLISEKCQNPEDLDCLCAALTFGTNTEKEKSEAIAKYIIKRFSYNRGDTSQQNIKGLVFGKEKEAVCEGYSRVYKDLMSRIGIKSEYVSGAVRNSIHDVFYTGHSHAWNQVVLDNIAYVNDITWSKNTSSEWYLKSPKDMIISHFEDTDFRGKANLYDSTLTMYDFIQLPFVDPIEANGHNKLALLDKTNPIQFAKEKFTINFKQNLNVTNINRNELGYPFVQFEGEKNEVARKVIANDGKLTNKISTKSVSINLPELINYLTIDIDGIGTIHYVVINGTESQFYESLIANFDDKNAYSIAVAFLACAKLKNEKIYTDLKPYMVKPMKFKDFMKEAEKMNLNQFKFSLFNASRHTYYNYSGNNSQEGSADDIRFEGYSFSFSNLPKNEEGKIFMQVNATTGTYKFKAFAKDSWDF